jgi:hypothetical protein
MELKPFDPKPASTSSVQWSPPSVVAMIDGAPQQAPPAAKQTLDVGHEIEEIPTSDRVRTGHHPAPPSVVRNNIVPAPAKQVVVVEQASA